MASRPRPDAELLTIGQIIGSYRVVQRLGAGGMGAVYEAVHTALGRRAAIKVLFPDRTPSRSTDPMAAARFFNETGAPPRWRALRRGSGLARRAGNGAGKARARTWSRARTRTRMKTDLPRPPGRRAAQAACRR